jgi:hypothetical protein
MSVSARCIAIGVMVFLYWVAAFVVAVMNVLAGLRQFPADGWWNVTLLREPGFRLGSPVFELLERVPGWDYAYILGWPLYIALFITAAALGTGAWLLSALVTGWWLRRKRS